MDSAQQTTAVALLTLGGFVAVMNWACVIVTARTGKFHSVVPLFGAAFLAAGAALTPPLRPYAWTAVPLDVGTVLLLLAAPRLAREWWDTSWFNLLEEYVGRKGPVTVRVRLFRRGVLHVWWDVRRPPGEYGVLGMGNVGTWGREADGVVLRVGQGRAVLEPTPGDDGRYRVVGFPLPHPELSLDGVELARGGR